MAARISTARWTSSGSKFDARRGAGYRDEAGWARQVANVADASAAGVDVMTVTHSANSDAAAARYGYASALLASRGQVLFASVGDYHTETWFPDYERDLGAPTGPMETHERGLRSRAFKRGLVVVNPTREHQRTESGAMLRPHSALILQASSGQWPCASKYSRASSSLSRSWRPDHQEVDDDHAHREARDHGEHRVDLLQHRHT